MEVAIDKNAPTLLHAGVREEMIDKFTVLKIVSTKVAEMNHRFILSKLACHV
jgi:hypothetical protein